MQFNLLTLSLISAFAAMPAYANTDAASQPTIQTTSSNNTEVVNNNADSDAKELTAVVVRGSFAQKNGYTAYYKSSDYDSSYNQWRNYGFVAR